MRKQFIYILICLFVATALFVSAEVQSYAAPKRGDVIKFGRADQDGSAKNGKEPIYWTVLSNEDGQITAISRDILYCLVYKQEDEVDNLIYNFRKAAFTENEKGKLDDIELPSLELIRSLTNRKARWTKTAQASANNLRNRLKKNNGLKSYSGAWWDKYYANSYITGDYEFYDDYYEKNVHGSNLDTDKPFDLSKAGMFVDKNGNANVYQEWFGPVGIRFVITMSSAD